MRGTKACPWCAEKILSAARKCKHCGEFLDSAGVVESGSVEGTGSVVGRFFVALIGQEGLRSKKSVVVGVVAVFAVVAATAAYALSGGDGSTEASGSVLVETTTTGGSETTTSSGSAASSAVSSSTSAAPVSTSSEPATTPTTTTAVAAATTTRAPAMIYRASSPVGVSEAQHVEFLSDGRIVVAGEFEGDFHGLNSGGDVDGFVMLLNPTGDVVWAEGFETHGQRYLGVLGDDTIITMGDPDGGPSSLWTVSSTGESNLIPMPIGLVPTTAAVGDSSFLLSYWLGEGGWVTKHDSSGAQVGRWDAPAEAVFGGQAIADGDGGLVVGYLLPDPGSELSTAVMVRLDKDLNEVWSTQMPSTRWFNLYNRAGDVIWGNRAISPESVAPITVSLVTGGVLGDGNNATLTSNDVQGAQHYPFLGRGLCELDTSGSYRYPGPCERSQNAFFLAGGRGEYTPLLNSSSGEVVAIGTYLPQWDTPVFNSGSVVLARLVEGETVPVPVVVSVVIPEPDENNHLSGVAYDPVTGLVALVGVTGENGSQQAMVTLVPLGDAVSNGF